MKSVCQAALWMLIISGSLWSTPFVIAGPPATVTLLNGTTRQGEITGLSLDQIELTDEQGASQIPGDTVMMIELKSAPGSEKSGVASVHFADNSVIGASSFVSNGTEATLNSAEIGEVKIPIRQVSDVRFNSLDDKIAARWEDLRNRNARDDLIVIRKGDVLDYVSGTISTISAEAVSIFVRDRELAAPREKIFGVVFASRASPAAARRVSVKTNNGDQLQAEALDLTKESLQLTSTSLGKVTVPVDSVQLVDYGGGRIRYLADLQFDYSASKPPHENDTVVWFVARNAPSGTGGKAPLLIGQQEYRKGLWMHSGAVLRFRLNREYRQLRGVAGFDLTHVTRMPRFDPRVRLVIMGDDRELFSREFLWSDNPVPLDVNLTDVRELVIRVDSAGAAHGILEHFALGDAQVIQ